MTTRGKHARLLEIAARARREGNKFWARAIIIEAGWVRAEMKA